MLRVAKNATFVGCCLLALLAYCICARTVRADEASGTWTGSVFSDLNYYYERSTRVFLPTGGVKLEAPNGTRLHADYLLDVITSASVAAGRTADQLNDEFRHQPQVGIGKGFDIGDTRLDLDATGRYSTESDYESASATLDASLALFEKNTILHFSGSRLVDHSQSNSDPTFSGTIKAWAGSLSLEQVLNPTMVLTVGYQFGHQRGYLGNPYRFAQRQAAPEREHPPTLRLRHGLSSKWTSYVPSLRLAVHALARVYIDNWGVRGLNPELRVYKEFGELLLLRLRYRYYQQTEADFYRTSYPRDWEGAITSDPKLAHFRSHTVGFRVELNTKFLESTFLDFAANGMVYLQLDRVFTGIPRYGDQINGTGGGLLRF